MPCSIYTTSSLATLPLAPRAYGQPPVPATAASTTARPSSRQARMLASAWPYVSWKWTASARIGTSAATARSMAHALPGVPTPMVSPSEIS